MRVHPFPIEASADLDAEGVVADYPGEGAADGQRESAASAVATGPPPSTTSSLSTANAELKRPTHFDLSALFAAPS